MAPKSKQLTYPGASRVSVLTITGGELACEEKQGDEKLPEPCLQRQSVTKSPSSLATF